MKYWRFFVLLCAALAGLCTVPQAYAVRYTNSTYTVDGSIDGSFGVQGKSSAYSLTAIGGEPLIGNGSGGSYLLSQQVFPPPASLDLSVQPTGLAAYYPFDAGSGTVVYDASRYNNKGTNSTAAAWGEGKINGGWSDTSAAQSVTVPDNTALPTGEQMTLSMWIKPRTATTMTLSSQWSSANTDNAWSLETTLNADNLRFCVAKTAADACANYVETTNAGLSLGTWQHVTGVFDGRQSVMAERVKIYINGVRVTTALTGTMPLAIRDATASLTIANKPGTSLFFQGGLDELKLFTRALDDTAVKAEFDAQNAGLPGGVTLGTVQGNTANETSADIAVAMTGTAYQLLLSQNHTLESAGSSIPSANGTIAAPAAWPANGLGLGFSLVSASAPTGLPAKWGNGTNFAAIPLAPQAFYVRTGATEGVKDAVLLKYRVQAATMQEPGSYNNIVTYTGIVVP